MLVRMGDEKLAWRNVVPHTHDGGLASPGRTSMPPSFPGPIELEAKEDETPSASDSTSTRGSRNSFKDGDTKPAVPA